ncbi:hypothetical protein QQF64_017932 [Cirrhinus molitorella]|uniref:Uncharacterized protein n=1 Tax=Cirrhinus molitorella TaxID=172907 RepID=A0ABR3LNB6_9TELE
MDRKGGWIKEKGSGEKARTGESLRQMSPSPQIDGSWPVSTPSFDPAVLCKNDLLMQGHSRSGAKNEPTCPCEDLTWTQLGLVLAEVYERPLCLQQWWVIWGEPL